MPIRDHFPKTVKPGRFDPTRTQVDEIKLVNPMVGEPPDLVGYLRTGGCTAGCGVCCEAFVVPLRAESLTDADFEAVSHDQIVLPIEPEVRGRAGFVDWEYWLTLHDAWLLQSPNGLLTLPIPVQTKRPVPSPLAFGAWVVWLEEHDIALVWRQHETLLAYAPVKCGALTDEGLCELFGLSTRPQMCRPYPEHPLDIEGIDFCTYRFDPVNQQQITEVTVAARKRPPLSARRSGKGRKKKGRR